MISKNVFRSRRRKRFEGRTKKKSNPYLKYCPYFPISLFFPFMFDQVKKKKCSKRMKKEKKVYLGEVRQSRKLLGECSRHLCFVFAKKILVEGFSHLHPSGNLLICEE
ncbi:hypothetical protein CEXT_708591 [Caerostris extrusa]|uniref:Uncharacterized protein n=1 Tax=Caerostris extrusa TaxID=172846 RepID=A0AAV4PJE4_CAEEX|nr:hypothetical protein CEXT_708591 [Caerostris extrusa]